MSHPRVTVEKLTVQCNKLVEGGYEKLENCIKSQQFSVKSAHLDLWSSSSILPYLAPGILESIDIKGDQEAKENCRMMKKLMELEQWKMVQSVKFNGCRFPNPFDYLFNVEGFHVQATSLKKRHLEKIRDITYRSHNFESCIIELRSIDKLLETIVDVFNYAILTVQGGSEYLCYAVSPSGAKITIRVNSKLNGGGWMEIERVREKVTGRSWV